MVKNPKKYIQPQPELRKSLEKLIANGKKLFLATNSHQEFGNLIMSTTLGEDWKSLFALNIVNCRKPLFFQSKDCPFFVIDH